MHSGTAQIYSLLDRPAHVAAPYSMYAGRQRRKYGEVGVSKPVAGNNQTIAWHLHYRLRLKPFSQRAWLRQCSARHSAQKSP